MPMRNLSIIFVSAVISMVCYTTTTRNRDAAVIADAIDKIEAKYVEEIDRRDLFESAMRGMVEGLGDPHSIYLAPKHNKRMDEELEQEFGGVGILVHNVSDEDNEGKEINNRIFVLSVHPISPAKKMGLKPGDEIVEIDGRLIKGMEYRDAVKLMRGEIGKEVRLKLRRHGEKELLEKSGPRATIVVNSVLGDHQHGDWTWDYYLEDQPNIGYIRLTQFGKRSVEELKKALNFQGRKVQGLILDLRGNGGGLLPAAVDVCDLFIDKGKIVTTIGRGKVVDKRSYAKASTTAFDTDLPMVVLIDGNSASASEIVAACLQDHHRAVIVGQRSYGKGSVQNIFDLEAGRGAIKLTTATYWRPSGKNIHRGKDAKEEADWGVRPDEGMKVILSDEEIVEVYRLRQMRDYRNSLQLMDLEIRELLNRKPKDSKLPNDFQDPQLRKAIENIQQQIKPKTAEVKRA